MKDSTHDADEESHDVDDQDCVSISFGAGGRIIYDKTNSQAWIQADEDGVVDVTA